ncbi:uncharacterized protein [Fopius arisanus]|uniref:Marveld1_0 protein n=1 Tax=Fopius arisanus TaxID=64838 RepID=A0A0C9PJ54_9HYME|nr:PREDICTED: uncharacterized protein LOC105265228 [Fopius arisanus]
MSHTVTVRTATVTTSTSSILINTGFMRSYRGVLKVLELILGIICTGIMGYLFDYSIAIRPGHLFLFLMVTTFMIATFILVLSSLFSISSEAMISKTLFEVLYHAIAFGLLLAASINFMMLISDERRGATRYYNLHVTVASLGLINSVFYLLSTVFGIRSYRGL